MPMKTTFRFLILSVFGLILFAKIAKTQSTTATNTYSSSNFLGWGTTSGDLWFKVNNTTQMTLQNSTGYFGVGTSSPEYRLHVSGTSYSGSCLLLERSETNAYGTSLIFRSKKTIWGAVASGINIGNISFMGPTSTSNTYASGASVLAVTTESWTSGHGAKLTFSTTANGSTTSTERLVIDNNGYVGINQTTPGSMLDVKGTLRLSGSTSGYVGFSPAAAAGSVTYTLPSADGTSGQVLQTNGSGTLSWQTPTTSATAWQLAGNSGASSPFLGTTDNYPLDIRTNGELRMRIQSDGITFLYGSKISLGYYTPVEKLQVSGNAIFLKEGYPPSSSAECPRIRGGYYCSTDTTPDYSWRHDSLTGIFHPAYKIIAFSSCGAETMRIDNYGNLGIGTTSPSKKLHVEGDSYLNGNVGIGTPLIYNPRNYKLAVNGFIGAKEIYVENTSTTWPDYVFSNDYNLPSLNEVEKFVNQNKHLPDVPSAAEVAEKGQAVGEMNAVLLKKVEELTLYIIEQNKRMDEQQRKIQELESKINRQQNQ